MSRPATNGGSVRRRVVSLVVIALCSCGAGQSEREVRDRVETTIEQSCRANFPEPSARRDCIEMIRQETNAGIAAAEAWLDGAPMTSESAEEATADSPVEWLLRRSVPPIIAYVAMGLLAVYVAFSLVGAVSEVFPRRRTHARHWDPYLGNEQASNRAPYSSALTDAAGGGEDGGNGGDGE